MVQHQVTTLRTLDGADWDSDLSNIPNASFFHGLTWARILADTYGFAPLYLRTDDGAPPAFLPLMEVNSCLTGRRGVSLPFTDECDAPGAKQDSFDRLLRASLDYLSSRNWRYLELRGNESNLSAAVGSARFFGHEIRFSERTPEDAFAKFSNSTRGAIKKAEKSGVVVEAASKLEDMDAFYSLLCQTRQRHGNPPQPIKFFRELHRHAIEANSGLLLLARHQGSVVAGAIFLHSGQSAIYKYAASNSESRHLSANNLVLWRALERYTREGYSSMLLGRTSLENEGLRRFKLGWGSREYSIKYFRYAKKAREFVAGTDNSSGWQTRIFKLLPQRLSRHLGALAYKHIA
jgi:hypothetical protein